MTEITASIQRESTGNVLELQAAANMALPEIREEMSALLKVPYEDRISNSQIESRYRALAEQLAALTSPEVAKLMRGKFYLPNSPRFEEEADTTERLRALRKYLIESL